METDITEELDLTVEWDVETYCDTLRSGPMGCPDRHEVVLESVRVGSVEILPALSDAEYDRVKQRVEQTLERQRMAS